MQNINSWLVNCFTHDNGRRSFITPCIATFNCIRFHSFSYTWGFIGIGLGNLESLLLFHEPYSPTLNPQTGDLKIGISSDIYCSIHFETSHPSFD